MAKLLLSRGASIDALGGRFGSALQAAYATRNDDTVRVLLDYGADVNVQGGKYGNALQAACTRWKVDLMTLLLDHGADVNAKGGKYGNALQAACVRGDNDVVRLLLDQGADVHASGGEHGSALQAAATCAYGHGLGTLELLLQRGADVNQQGGTYGTALQAAAANNNEDCVKLLLDHGADVHLEGGEYKTALQAACAPNCMRRMRPYREDDPTVEFDDKKVSSLARALLDRGADVHIQGGRFGSAWHAAVRTYAPLPDWQAFMQLLLDRGVDINDARGQPPHTPTALHAVLYMPYYNLLDKVDWIDFLLAHGADPALSAGTYGTPLQAACAAHYEPFESLGVIIFKSRVAHLLEKCPDLDVNARGGLFGCALQAAAYSGQTESVRLLIERKADVNLRGGEYRSALNAAVVKGYWDIVEALLAAGAEPDCWSLREPDEEWLGWVFEKDGRGAWERYWKFWEKQMDRGKGPEMREGAESIASST